MRPCHSDLCFINTYCLYIDDKQNHQNKHWFSTYTVNWQSIANIKFQQYSPEDRNILSMILYSATQVYLYPSIKFNTLMQNFNFFLNIAIHNLVADLPIQLWSDRMLVYSEFHIYIYWYNINFGLPKLTILYNFLKTAITRTACVPYDDLDAWNNIANKRAL